MTNTAPKQARKRILTPRVPTTVDAGDSIFSAPVSREFRVERIKATTLWIIKYEGGGPVPLPLRGMYTTESAAYRALDKFKQANK